MDKPPPQPIDPRRRTGLPKVLVADDEPLARARLRRLLSRRSDVHLVGCCETGRQAIAAVRSQRPDILFLDVRMPDRDGFEVVDAIDPSQRPVVVFVTAHDTYALRAFDARALDYLLKPFDDERFERSLGRALAQAMRLRGEKVDVRVPAGDNARIPVRSGRRVRYIDPLEIRLVKAQGSYVRLFAGERRYLLRRTMHRMERELPTDTFQRVHRSTIVNLTCVRELRRSADADRLVVLLDDGSEHRVSETYRSRLNARLWGRSG